MQYEKWMAFFAGLSFVFPPSLPVAAADLPAPDRAEVVATVNGHPLFAAQLAPLVEERLRRYQRLGIASPDQAVRQLFSRQALESLIEDELLHQAGQALEASTPKADSPSEPDPGAHRRSIDLYLAATGLLEPPVPEETIRRAYEKTKSGFALPEKVTIRQILIRVEEDASAQARKEAHRRMNEARRQLELGRPFVEVVAHFSECNSAAWGGELGPFGRGYMPAGIDDVAFSLSPGVLSEVIETGFGLHTLEVLSRTPAGYADYEDVRDLLAKRLQKELAAEALKSHLEELKKTVRIEIFL